MRLDAAEVEDAIRAVLDEMGLTTGPVVVEFPSGYQGVGDPFLGEDRDAPQEPGIAVFVAMPDGGDTLERVYLMEAGPDGRVEAADVDQNLRTVRLGDVADAVWERIASVHETTTDRVLAFD